MVELSCLRVMWRPISEHFIAISGETKDRYTAKVSAVDLKNDPYAIPNELWVDEPDKVPNVSWSDVYLHDCNS